MGTGSSTLDLVFIGVILIAALYWILVAPDRARRRRREELRADHTHFQPWDHNIGARKRER